ncbi:T7SS effector LXG polymorphic toxin [Listeria seeligeri]|uniref:T7SS effector LXG polymorphic toxin n=1 Tax=Listeria seeligeri TaxID=1640 RepID=UPI0018881903|nr:T7SS effector LXG polymorphic toxin [Listeria seeligeri]MBF2544268.1 LXG domain-containing protein [Listeria seeligeri]MBF2641265.1 LXG domain-containing protein [Listeria seeligeri]
MSRMDIGEVQTFLTQLRTSNENGEKAIQSIQKVVTQYAEDDSLKGKAIDASKRYYQATYISLCDAMKEAMSESEDRLSQYIQDFHAQVDSSANAKIDAAGLYELELKIDKIERNKEDLAQRMNSGTEGQMQNYRSQLSAAYKKENILEKYLSFEQSHGSFFENLTVLVQSIQQTVRELQNNIQFNSQTGTYDMSKLDIQPLERMRKALDKAKSNEATINFDDYQKDYRGGKWVLQKDGKVDVEATNAYNEAVLNGTLPKKANAATQEAELLKGILASLKNKKDPITGADISSVQVLSILSGLAFSYRAGRYRGKKLRIPNPDKRKRKKTSGGKLDFNNNKFSGINEMTKDDILNDLPVGWKYTENNGFIHVRDSSGNVRMKFDPPDNVTNFDHIHLFDNNGNPIDINGNVVNRKSSDAHIPYKK